MINTVAKDFQTLINKYGVSVPRYTSYPTAPEWQDQHNQEELDLAIRRSNKIANDYSLYFHIPFCESQCYYCACNVVISQKRSIADQYVDRLIEEIKLLGSKISKERRVIQMAWGGGTPTYLSLEQINKVYQAIKENFSLYNNTQLASINDFEYSIEIDPRVTSKEQIKLLFELGFNRLSMGIQDFNHETQEIINRKQSFSEVKEIVDYARYKIGFKSINFDLIYGLPLQNLNTFKESLDLVSQIDPDRIALFNYAHIPSLFPFQKKYILDEYLPDQKEKCLIFDYSVDFLTNKGYEFIGIDHFAKAGDSLIKAQKENKLYRNFQGYTTHDGCDLFGLGITAISDINGIFKQNPKKLNDYYSTFKSEKFKICSNSDIERRKIIKELMCESLTLLDIHRYAKEINELKKFEKDGLISIKDDKSNTNLLEVSILNKGRMFSRNIASTFDTYLQSKQGFKNFSKAL